MKKKGIIIKISLVTIVLLILLIICILLSKGRYSERISVTSKYIEYCNKNVECVIPHGSFLILKTDINNRQLKKVIKRINRETNELYDRSLNSTTNDSECVTSESKKYAHKIIPENIIDIYEDEEIITIAVERSFYNACTDKDESISVETYYYDVKNKKLISQDKLLKKYRIKNIGKTIGRNIMWMNIEKNKNYTYQDTKENYRDRYWVYFDYEGQARVYYKQNSDNKYYSAKLNYKIKD